MMQRIETVEERSNRYIWMACAEKFRERTGNKTVSWVDIKPALLNGRTFIIADGTKYNLLKIVPEMYSK